MASVASSQSNMGGPSHHERAAPVSAGSAAAGGTTSGTEDGMVDTSGDADDYDDLPGVGDKRAKRGFSKRVTLRDLERYFEYPIEQVSKMMGVSTTIIKRLCRKYGIKRWPYRQIRSVNKSIKYVELLARTAIGPDRNRLQEQLVSLHYKKQLICQAATTGASAKVRKSILQMRPEELDADTLLRSGVPGGTCEGLGFAGGDGLNHDAAASPRTGGGGEGDDGDEETERAAAMQVTAAQQAAAQQAAAMQQQAPTGAGVAAGSWGGHDQTERQVSEAAHAAATQAAAAAAAIAASQGVYGIPPHMQMAGMPMGYSPYVHMAAAAQAQQQAMVHQQGEGGGAGGGMDTSQVGAAAHMHAYGHLGMYGGYPGMMGLPYGFQPHGYPGMPGYGVPGMGGYPSLAGGGVGAEHMASSMGMSGMAAMQMAVQTMQQQQHEQQEAMYHEHQQRQQEEVAAAAAQAAAVSEAAPTAPVNPTNTPPPLELQQDAEPAGNGSIAAGRRSSQHGPTAIDVESGKARESGESTSSGDTSAEYQQPAGVRSAV